MLFLSTAVKTADCFESAEMDERHSLAKIIKMSLNKNTAKLSGIASCFCLTLSMFSSPLDFQTNIEPLPLKELATSNLDNVSKPCGVQLMVEEAVTYPILRYSGSI